MPETAQCYRIGGLDWLSVLELLAEGATALGPLVKAGLCIQVLQNEARLIVPSPYHGPHRRDDAMKASMESLRAAIGTRGINFDPFSEGPSTLNLELYGHPVAALALMAARATTPDSKDAARPIESEHFALAVGDSDKALAATLGTVSWQAPAVRVSASVEGKPAAVLQFGDVGTSVPAADAFATSKRSEGFHLLDVYSSGGLRLALARATNESPRGRRVPSHGSLTAFSRAAPTFSAIGLEQAGSPPDTVTTIAVVPGAIDEVWQFPLPRETAALFRPADEVLEFAFRRFVPHKEALERLEAAWEDLPKAGHRLELRPVPANPTPDDPERLGDQIKTLERRRDLVLALQAPQFRLLRFSSGQLEAMVDALRSMPPETIDTGVIKYGFHATDTDPKGAHYLCWSDGEATPESHFREHFWRVQTEDRPIRYWLDPAWARFYGSRNAEVKSHIMVPEGQRLAPALHAFGGSDIDNFLREHLAYGGTVPERPIYLVSPSAKEGFTYTVEILDFEAFQPFRKQVRWVSNVLEVLGGIDLREFVELGADLSVRTRILAKLEQDSTANRKALAAAATALEEKLSDRLGGYLTMLTREVDALSAHIVRLSRLVDELTADSQESEKLVAAMIDTTADRADRIAKVGVDVAGLQAERKAIGDGLVKSVAATNAFAESSRLRIEAAEARLARLRELIDGTRYG
jgi:hypothetical protein